MQEGRYDKTADSTTNTHTPTTVTVTTVSPTTCPSLCSLTPGSSDLESLAAEEDKDPYGRFPFRQKCVFTLVVACVFFQPFLVAYGLMPALDKIAAEFNVSDTVVIIGNALFYIVQGLSVFFVGPLCETYGRKAGLLTCCFFFCVSGIGLALSPNLACYYVFRAMSAVGGNSTFSVGVAVISDIWKPEQRSKAVGVCLAGTQIGSALGPVLGGLIVLKSNWRNIFWLQCGIGGLAFMVVAIVMRETKPNTPFSLRKPGQWFFPLHCTHILRAFGKRHIMIVTLSLIFALYVNETLIAPIASIMKPRFNLENELILGLFYVPQGVGYFFGCLVGGWYADVQVKKWAKIKGRRVPEDRLRSVIICTLITGPLFMILYGWSLQKEFGGMALPIVAMLLIGFSLSVYYPSVNAYYADSTPDLGGAAVMINYSARNVGSCVTAASTLSAIRNIGIGWAATIAGIACFLAALPILFLIYRGEAIREAEYGRIKVREDEKKKMEEDPCGDEICVGEYGRMAD